MKYLLFAFLGYISGSVLYAYLIPKFICGKDIIQLSEDHNPGATNAFQYAGVSIGSIVIVCELLKGAIPVFLAQSYLNIEENVFALIMMAPVIGHAYSLFFRRKGGKAIAVSFGVLLGIVPLWKPVLCLAGFYLLFSCIFIIHPHSYRSIITFLLFGMTMFYVMREGGIRYGCLGLSGIVIWKHIKSIRLKQIEVHKVIQDK